MGEEGRMGHNGGEWVCNGEGERSDFLMGFIFHFLLFVYLKFLCFIIFLHCNFFPIFFLNYKIFSLFLFYFLHSFDYFPPGPFFSCFPKS